MEILELKSAITEMNNHLKDSPVDWAGRRSKFEYIERLFVLKTRECQA